MTQFNIKNNNSIDQNYNLGLLPQRNQKDIYYLDSSARSNLNNFNLSSENRRILKKTEEFQYELIPLKDFDFNLETQKKIFSWIKKLNWDFPTSSIKTIFTNHIFNYLHVEGTLSLINDNLSVDHSCGPITVLAQSHIFLIPCSNDISSLYPNKSTDF